MLCPDGVENPNYFLDREVAEPTMNDYWRRRTHVKGVASPSTPSWNQILTFLQQMANLRRSVDSAA
jgi:hypothetical protein